MGKRFPTEPCDGRPEGGWEPLPAGFCWAVAGTLVILASMALAAVLVVDRDTAGRIMKEDALVETLQAFLFGSCGLLSAWRAARGARRGEPVAPQILITYLFMLLLVAEQDLDVHLFGVRVVHTRFLLNPTVWLPYRVAAVLVLVGAPLLLAVYGFRHLRELWRAGWRGLREPRVWLGVTGTAIFGVTELFERRLARLGDLPRNFLEEGLELVAAICLLVAFAFPARMRTPR